VQDQATTELSVVEKETGDNPRLSIIWMHGLGADANDFVSAVPALSLGPDRPIRFIFPNAPQRPVTINGGMVMRAWFDVLGVDMDSRVDEQGVRESAAAIELLIQKEIERGVPADRIILAGFSQGGAVALFCSLRFPQKLAGVIALSTYLPVRGRVGVEASEDNRSTSIFMAHGEFDPVLPFSLGEQSRDWLNENGYQVQWNSYRMEHSVVPQELRDIREYLSECYECVQSQKEQPVVN